MKMKDLPDRLAAHTALLCSARLIADRARTFGRALTHREKIALGVLIDQAVGAIPALEEYDEPGLARMAD